MGCNNSVPLEPQAQQIRNTISISKIAAQRGEKGGKKIAKVLKTFDQFFNELKLMLNEEQIFDTIFKADYIQQILNTIREGYVNHQETTKIISIVLQYMALSKNTINGTKNLKTGFQLNNFPSQLSAKWKEIKRSILLTNISPLKVLHILQADESKNMHSLSYFEVLTQLNAENCLKIINLTRQVFRHNEKALCFFSNFILKSASIFFDKNRSVKDVQIKIREVLTQLSQIQFIKPTLQGQQNILQHHKSFKIKDNTLLNLDLKKVINTQRVDALDKFILGRAKAALKYFRHFNRTLQDTCSKFQCYSFQSKLRLKSRTQKEQILRIKLQLLGASLQKLKIEPLNSSQKDNYSLCDTLDAQLQKMNKTIEHICQNYDDSIQFTPTDMISASCKFSDLTQLNNCLEMILKEVLKKGFKVIQVNNHLQAEQQRPQIVVKILIQDLITEFRLIFDYNSAEFLISKFINKLLLCKGPNLLLQLKKINNDITTNFIQQANSIIDANLHQKGRYRQKLSFSEAKQLLTSFIKYIPIKVDLKKQPSSAIDFNLFFQFLDQYKSIVEEFTNETIKVDKAQKLRRIADYLFQSEKYDVSLMVLNLYLKEVQQNNAYLFQKIKGGSKQLIGTEVELIKNYSEALNYSAQINQNKGCYEEAIGLFKKYEFYNKLFTPSKEEQIAVLQKISSCYLKSRKYQQAYTVTQDCIKINGQGQLKPKLLHNLSSIQVKLKRKSESLQNLDERLKLIIKKYGKHSIQSMECLSDIGQLLKHYKQFDKLKSNLLESISVIMGTKGKYCKQYAFTVKQLASLHSKLKQHQKSIQYSKQALQIFQRLNHEFALEIMKLNSKLANNYYELQKYEQSIIPYEKSIQLGQKLESVRNTNQFRMNLNGLALAYQQLAQYQQSFRSFTRAIKITQHLYGAGSIQYSRMLINIGALEDFRKNFTQSLSCYKQAKQILQSLSKKQTTQYATIMNNIGLLLQDQSLYHDALAHFKQSLTIKKKLNQGLSIDLVPTLSNIASVYDDMGMYQQAIKYYKDSNDILEKDRSHNQNQFSQNYNNIGTVFLHLRDYRKSQQYYKKSMELQRHSTIEYAISLTCIGLLNLQNGKVAAAEEYLNKSLDLYHVLNKEQVIEYCQALIGFSKLCLTQRMFKQSLQYVKRARQVSLKQKRQNHVLLITISLYEGITYFRQRQFYKSIRALQQGLKICQTKHLLYKQYSEINFYLGLVYFQMQDFKKSSRYLEKVLILLQKYHHNQQIALLKLIHCYTAQENQSKVTFYRQLCKQQLIFNSSHRLQ